MEGRVMGRPGYDEVLNEIKSMKDASDRAFRRLQNQYPPPPGKGYVLTDCGVVVIIDNEVEEE